MNFIVERNICSNKFTYKIDGDENFYAESNLTFNIGLRKIDVLEANGKSVYSLKQENLLVKVLTWIPLLVLPIDLLPKYKFYNKNVNKGGTSYSFFTPKRTININNYCYELYLHKNNYISIMKNDKQIALIRKIDITIMEKNKYLIIYDEILENDINLLLLFIVFIDVIFYPNKFKVSYAKYEKTVGIDKLYDRTLWNPQDIVE